MLVRIPVLPIAVGSYKCFLHKKRIRGIPETFTQHALRVLQSNNVLRSGECHCFLCTPWPAALSWGGPLQNQAPIFFPAVPPSSVIAAVKRPRHLVYLRSLLTPVSCAVSRLLSLQSSIFLLPHTRSTQIDPLSWF